MEEMILAYMDYRTAIVAKPYNPDTVQALGMAFARKWNACREVLVSTFEITDEEFEYALHHTLMPQVIEGRS